MQPRLAFICWILFFPLLAYQQESNMLWFHAPDALPNYSPSFNYWVYHDSEGFAWISSTAGLNRFDGARVRHYSSNLADSTSLFTGENIQSSFFEDRQKNLWFATGEAVHCYIRKHDNFRHFQVRDKDSLVVQASYRVFFLEKDSFLWLTADSSIYRLNIHQPDEFTFIAKSDDAFHRADTLADGSVRAVYRLGNIEADEFNYWVIENGKLKGRKRWFREGNHQPAPSSVIDLLADNDRLTWLGTDKGLVAWNPQTGDWRKVGGLDMGLCHIEAWGSKALLVWSLSKGLFLFDKKEEAFTPMAIRRIDGLKISPQDVFEIYLDKADNLWVSFLGSGLIYANLNKTKFRSFPKSPAKDGNTSYSYWASLWDGDGNFWHGSNPNGLFLLNGNGQLLQQFRHRPGLPNSLPGDWVTNLLQDKKRRIWIGTSKGLAWMDPRQKGIFHPVLPESKSPLYIVGLCQLKKSASILVSSIGQGIFMVKEKEGKTVLKRVAPKRDFGIIYEDKSGRIYSGRDEAEIAVFSLQNDTLLLVKTVAVNGIVTGFYEDQDGKTLWVASMSGLVKLNLDSLKVDTIFTEKDGLTDKNIHAMLADDSENLWLSTPKGLVHYQRKDGRFRQFGLADGMQSTEFQFLAGAKHPNGELWFGGANGITIVPPGQVDSLKTKTVVKITDLKINDMPPVGLKDADTGATNVTEIRRIVRPFGDNTLSFEFVAIEYSDPTNNSLRYKLEGIDDKWIELKRGELGFARYPKLRFGKYTLWIQGANSDGVWGEPVAAIEATIRPPFYLQWWFILLAALVLTATAWLIIRNRIAHIREKADLNTRIAENKMTALRAQMNPHFVFNSLQTVNAFIAKQDLRGAMDYVNQFAMLMRVILENSREGQISLEREIELLELYMKIEARRFVHPFTYSMNVGEGVDTYSMEIPSMLLQPFVENAIKHGLFHKKESGHINIAFLKEDGSLKCVVEDNGVGRAKATEINTQQGRSHKSRGLQIVNERLAIIRAANHGNYDVKISDLFDRQQNPSGTRVEITLPIS